MSSLKSAYTKRFDGALAPIALAIEHQLRDLLSSTPRVDRVSCRPKSAESFLKKARKISNGAKKYKEPLEQIQDQIGARVVTFYVSDIPIIQEIVRRYYKPIETKSHIPENEWEFGYFGIHYIVPIPNDCINPKIDARLVPKFFEIQIKTLFQHAWSEAGHDLGYKPGEEPLTSDQIRRLAFTSAQSWGADQTFDALFQEKMKKAPH